MWILAVDKSIQLYGQGEAILINVASSVLWGESNKALGKKAWTAEWISKGFFYQQRIDLDYGMDN